MLQSDASKSLTSLAPPLSLCRTAVPFSRATIVNGSVSAVPHGSQKRSLANLGAEWYLPQVPGETADDIIDAVLADRYTRSSRPPHSRTSMSREDRLVRRADYGDNTWQSTGEWNVISRIGGNGRHVRTFCFGFYHRDREIRTGGSIASFYPRMVTTTPDSVLIFTVPANTSFGSILGSVNWNHGTFKTQTWPGQDRSLASEWQTFNASSRWASTGQIKWVWVGLSGRRGTGPDGKIYGFADFFKISTHSGPGKWRFPTSVQLPSPTGTLRNSGMFARQSEWVSLTRSGCGDKW
jgi:hypothetical protein